jgi:two-component system, cell cycle response regulator DivK
MENKKRILIVEDNLGSRRLLAAVFARSGYKIAEAANGLEALKLIRETRPDLIILDLDLPGMAGDEVIQLIKEDASVGHIPILVTTFFDPESAHVQRAQAAGASKILYKPTPMKDFEEEVRRHLSTT